MRSRERLIEVMRSVNGDVAWPALRQNRFNEICDALEDPVAWNSVRLINRLENISKYHLLPHIRELAAEALHYLKGEN